MRTVPTEAREYMKAAQFFYADAYTDWAWAERAKASIPAPVSSKAWPFRRFDHDANVVELKSRKKK